MKKVSGYFSGVFSIPNSVYVITGEVNLGGATEEVASNCVLTFEGGCCKNGTLKGNMTLVEALPSKQIFDGISLQGTWSNTESFVEWFGARGDGIFDDGPALNAIFTSPFMRVCLQNKEYQVGSKPIGKRVGLEVTSPKQIVGVSIYDKGTTIKAKSNVDFEALLLISSSQVELSNLKMLGTDKVKDLITTYLDGDSYRFVSKLQFYNVSVFTCSRTCVRLSTFLSTLKRVSCAFCSVGIELHGNVPTYIRGTSTILEQCYVQFASLYGYRLDYMSYSKLESCCMDYAGKNRPEALSWSNVNTAYPYYISASDTLTLNSCACEMSYNAIRLYHCRAIHINSFSDWSSKDKEGEGHNPRLQIYLKDCWGVRFTTCFMGSELTPPKKLVTGSIIDSERIVFDRSLLRKEEGRMSNNFWQEENVDILRSSVEFQ